MHARFSRPRFPSLGGACALVATFALLSACTVDLGTPDREAALEIVYTADGTPAFAGQAMINQSCGGGGFCHAADIDPIDRVGAPAELNFNLNIASASSDLNEAEVLRLDRDQLRTFDERHSILEQVQRGLMPPPGPESENVLASVVQYDRVSDDGMTFSPLPAVDSEEGEEILRNWLSSGTPVVERTVERIDGDNTVGFTVAQCDRRCVDPTWPDIVQQILIPSCALSRCHDSDEPAAMLDLSLQDPTDPTQLAGLLTSLTGTTAQGTLCAASMAADTPMFVAGDADGSLMIQKVTPALLECGSLMPLSGSELSEQRLCALRAWVECGACADPTDAACAACQDTARAMCGVMLNGSGEPECIETVACPRFADDSMM